MVNKKMKIDFSGEIVKCFSKQYPEKEENYNRIIHTRFYDNDFLEIYNDMMETIPILIKLIIKLQNGQI